MHEKDAHRQIVEHGPALVLCELVAHTHVPWQRGLSRCPLIVLAGGLQPKGAGTGAQRCSAITTGAIEGIEARAVDGSSGSDRAARLHHCRAARQSRGRKPGEGTRRAERRRARAAPNASRSVRPADLPTDASTRSPRRARADGGDRGHRPRRHRRLLRAGRIVARRLDRHGGRHAAGGDRRQRARQGADLPGLVRRGSRMGRCRHDHPRAARPAPAHQPLQGIADAAPAGADARPGRRGDARPEGHQGPGDGQARARRSRAPITASPTRRAFS